MSNLPGIFPQKGGEILPERRFKDGVDYWNIDIDFFENKKVRLIRGEFGIKGVYLYILILNEIYRTGGYYKKWDRDDCLLMSDSSGVAGDCSPELIAEVVRGLVRRSLFDKGVLDRFGVLTSAEIQRRFLRIVGNSRESIPMVQDYFLLEPSSRKDVTRATLSKIVFFSINSKDSTQNLKGEEQNFKVLDKEKNRTEQKRTEEIGGTPAAPAPTHVPSEGKDLGSGFVPPTVEEVAEYVRFRGSCVNPQVWFDYYAARGWMMGRAVMKDWRAAVKASETWERWQKPGSRRDVKTPSDYESGESFV